MPSRGRGHNRGRGGYGRRSGPQPSGDGQQEGAGGSAGSSQSSQQDEEEYTFGDPVDPETGRTLNRRPFLRCKLEGHDLFAIMTTVIPAPFITTKTMEELNLTGRLNQNVTGSCWGPVGDTYPIVGVLEGLNVWFSDQLQFTCDFYVKENEHYEVLMFDLATFFKNGCESQTYGSNNSVRFKRDNGTVVDIPFVKFIDELPSVARRCAMSPLFGYQLNTESSADGQEVLM